MIDSQCLFQAPKLTSQDVKSQKEKCIYLWYRIRPMAEQGLALVPLSDQAFGSIQCPVSEITKPTQASSQSTQVKI